MDHNHRLEVPGSSLGWSLLDLVPPWIEVPGIVVVQHGIGATSAMFDGWLPRMIGTHRVLRFDMRGHGASGCPSADVAVDMNRLVDDLLAVMDAAGVARADLIGEAIGGTIVLAAALRAPERVRTVTVSNGAHLGASLQAVEGWRRMMNEDGMEAWSDYMMPIRFHSGAISETAWHWFHRQQATVDSDTVLRLLAAFVGTDLTAELPGLRPPLLLLHPDESRFIPVPVVAALRDLVPGSRLHVVGHSRHGLPFSHAGVCSAIWAGFVAEHAA